MTKSNKTKTKATLEMADGWNDCREYNSQLRIIQTSAQIIRDIASYIPSGQMTKQDGRSTITNSDESVSDAYAQAKALESKYNISVSPADQWKSDYQSERGKLVRLLKR